jgi:hypothetical protein
MSVNCVKWGFILKSHKDLVVWKRSIAWVTGIYRITKAFPDDRKYGMIRQIRRSAVSIPSNIAFCSGSLSELETQLTSHCLEYISGELLETYLKRDSWIQKHEYRPDSLPFPLINIFPSNPLVTRYALLFQWTLNSRQPSVSSRKSKVKKSIELIDLINTSGAQRRQLPTSNFW